MKIRDYHKVEKRTAYRREKSEGASLRVAISREDGANDLSMSIYEIDPAGFTPLHSHPWEHAVYVISGKGVILDSGKERRLGKDDVLYIPADQKHQIKNTGEFPLVLVSVIPIKDR